jgi:hypothetical protein
MTNRQIKDIGGCTRLVLKNSSLRQLFHLGEIVPCENHPVFVGVCQARRDSRGRYFASLLATRDHSAWELVDDNAVERWLKLMSSLSCGSSKEVVGFYQSVIADLMDSGVNVQARQESARVRSL